MLSLWELMKMNYDSNIDQITAIASELIKFIFDNEDSFLDRFGKFDATDLTEVGFSEHHVHITYVCYEGQHVCDSVCIEDFREWCGEIGEMESE